MTKQEAIEIIDIVIAEVEWELPMDYAAAFDMAKEALQEQINKESSPCYTCDREDCSNCINNGRIELI